MKKVVKFIVVLLVASFFVFITQKNMTSNASQNAEQHSLTKKTLVEEEYVGNVTCIGYIIGSEFLFDCKTLTNEEVKCIPYEDELCTTKDGKLITGIIKYYNSEYENPLQITSYKKGKKDGTEILYYNSGDLQAEANYKAGLLDGKYKRYSNYFHSTYEDLNRVGYIEEGNYKAGLLDGIYKEYRDEKLSTEANYKAGLLDGIYKSYYKSGQLREEKNYKAGLLDGIYKGYDINGKLVAEGNFKEGNGKIKVYVPDGICPGALSEERNYKANKLNGIYKDYICGDLKEEKNYKAGLLDGIYKRYDRNGKLEMEGYYKADRKHGIWENHRSELKYKYFYGCTEWSGCLQSKIDFNSKDELQVYINQEAKSPYMTYDHTGKTDLSKYTKELNKHKAKVIFDNNKQENKMYYEYFPIVYNTFLSLWNYGKIDAEYYDNNKKCSNSIKCFPDTKKLNAELRCTNNHKKTEYELDRECEKDFYANKQRYYDDCVSENEDIKDHNEKIRHWRDVCTKMIVNNGMLKQCIIKKEINTCEGGQEFIVTNKQGELVLKSSSLSEQKLENIYYPQAVKDLANKYGSAQNSVIHGPSRNSATHGNSEVFYWVDKDWVLRIDILLDRKGFKENAKVKKAIATFVNPNAFTEGLPKKDIWNIWNLKMPENVHVDNLKYDNLIYKLEYFEY